MSGVLAQAGVFVGDDGWLHTSDGKLATVPVMDHSVEWVRRDIEQHEYIAAFLIAPERALAVRVGLRAKEADGCQARHVEAFLSCALATGHEGWHLGQTKESVERIGRIVAEAMVVGPAKSLMDIVKLLPV